MIICPFFLCSAGTFLSFLVTNDAAKAEGASFAGKTCPYNLCTYRRYPKKSFFGRYSYTTTKVCRMTMQKCSMGRRDCCTKDTGCCSFREMAPYLIAVSAIAGVIFLCCLVGCCVYFFKKKKKRSLTVGTGQAAAAQTPGGYPRQVATAPGYAVPPPGYPAASATGYPAPTQSYPAPAAGYPTSSMPFPGYAAPPPGYAAPPPGFAAPPPGYPVAPPDYSAPTSKVSFHFFLSGCSVVFFFFLLFLLFLRTVRYLPAFSS